MPCSSVPPASETRSASPIKPVPAPGSGAAAATATGARLRTSTSRSPSGARTVRVTAAPGACLRAFVRPSCAIRYAVRPAAAGILSALMSPPRPRRDREEDQEGPSQHHPPGGVEAPEVGGATGLGPEVVPAPSLALGGVDPFFTVRTG